MCVNKRILVSDDECAKNYDHVAKRPTNHLLRCIASVGAICHSIGCNTMVQLLAEFQPYNELVKPVFHLAPFVYSQKTGSVPLSTPAFFEPIFR